MIELLIDQANFCTPGETRDPIAVVEQFVSAYNAHDLKQLRILVTADAAFGSPSERLSGEQVLENYESIVFARFPAVRMIVEQRIASGDLVAQLDTIEGIAGLERGLTVYRVDGGCIVEMSINQ